MKKVKLFGLLFALLLTGCTTDDPSTSTSMSENQNSSQTSHVSEDDEDSATLPPSSEVVPLSDPDVSGLVRSELWPSAELSAYLLYDEEILMPLLTSEVSFHHGLYDDELFYRVLTRVRSYSDFLNYKIVLEEEYDFTFELIEEAGPNFYYGESEYDEVRVHLDYALNSSRHEVMFDFFDGQGDNYTGLEAVDNLATFDLRNEAAITKKSPTRVTWEVRPATFKVYKENSPFNVGHDNYAHLSILRLYAGQEAQFAVTSRYVITDLTILAGSGYALDTVSQGSFTNVEPPSVNGDWINITPLPGTSSIHYTRENVMNVGHTRWQEIRITIAQI